MTDNDGYSQIKMFCTNTPGNIKLDHHSAINTSLYLWPIKYGTNQKHVGYGLQTKKSLEAF